MKIAAVEAWVETPLKRYVDDARARLALLLHPSGQVVAQAGFTREVDVMTACALASAAHATSGALGKMVDGRAFRGLHYTGPEKQLYLAALETGRGLYICLTVFDRESSLGLVRMFTEELGRELMTSAPVAEAVSEPALAVNFEVELNRNLAQLFGRAPTKGLGGAAALS